MSKQLIILIGTICFGLAIGIALVYNPKHTQAQNVIELACPAGSYALGGLTTRNPSTGGIRQYGCVDANGNLSVSNAVGSVVVLNPSASQTITCPNGVAPCTSINAPASGQVSALNLNGSAGDAQPVLSIGSTGSGSIGVGTTTFASLPAVPAAGIFKYCSDCTTAATCAGAGSGHLAVSNGTNWTCQ